MADGGTETGYRGFKPLFQVGVLRFLVSKLRFLFFVIGINVGST